MNKASLLAVLQKKLQPMFDSAISEYAVLESEIESILDSVDSTINFISFTLKDLEEKGGDNVKVSEISSKLKESIQRLEKEREFLVELGNEAESANNDLDSATVGIIDAAEALSQYF